MKYLNKKQQENYIKNHLNEKGIKYEFVNNIFYIDNKLILSLQRVIDSNDEVFIIYPWNDIEKIYRND